MSLTPMRAIRAKCLDCSGGSPKEVRACPVTACPLWPLRFGKRPATVERRFQDHTSPSVAPCDVPLTLASPPSSPVGS
jgi:hypothetical protein